MAGGGDDDVRKLLVSHTKAVFLVAVYFVIALFGVVAIDAAIIALNARTQRSSSQASAKTTPAQDEAPVPPQRTIVGTDFETATLGLYRASDLARDFPTATTSELLLANRCRVEEVDDDASGKTRRALVVTYPAGQCHSSASGVSFFVALNASYDEVRLAYRLRFDDGFDFDQTHTGGKLPGLASRDGATADAMHSVSSWVMWRQRGRVVQYISTGPYTFCTAGICSPSTTSYLIPWGGCAFKPGKWHEVEQRIVMNTNGVADGMIETWFDGVLALRRSDFYFRPSGYTFGIDTLDFETFFGVPGRKDVCAPLKNETIAFDDINVRHPREMSARNVNFSKVA